MPKKKQTQEPKKTQAWIDQIDVQLDAGRSRKDIASEQGMEPSELYDEYWDAIGQARQRTYDEIADLLIEAIQRHHAEHYADDLFEWMQSRHMFVEGDTIEQEVSALMNRRECSDLDAGNDWGVPSEDEGESEAETKDEDET